MKRLPIEDQITEIEKWLLNAQQYLARNVNVEGKRFLHFDDWKGNSGHPLWIRNHMVPSLKRARKWKEKLLTFIENKTKKKEIAQRKRLARLSNLEQSER
jgi:hypothetical protein